MRSDSGELRASLPSGGEAAALWEDDAAVARVRRALPEEVRRHSLGVAETAARLAARHGVAPERAYLAGLVHDLAKPLPGEELLRVAAASGIMADEIQFHAPYLLHGPVGAVMAQREFGLDDPELLRAVANHTTGVPGMGDLELVVYLADAVEPGRRYAGVEQLREAAQGDLDEAVLAAVAQTLNSLTRRRMLIHPHSVETWNWLLLTRRRGR